MRSVIFFMLFVAGISPLTFAAPQPSSLLDEGIRQYREGTYREAVETLQKAVNQVHTPRERATCYFYIGCSYVGLRKQKQADGAFRQTLVVLPDFEVPKEVQRQSKIVESFDKARQQYTAKPTVQVSPPQAQMRGGQRKTVISEIPPPVIIPPLPRSAPVGQPIVLTVQSVSQMAPDTVKIYYRLENASNWQEATMHLMDLPDGARRTYEATLPSQSHVGTLQYYIRAEYPRGVQVRSPDKQKYHQITLVDTTFPRIEITFPHIDETVPIPQVPINEPIVIRARIQDNTSVKNAGVYYAHSQTPADFQCLPLVQTPQGEYTATLPAQSQKGQILYYLAATDEGNNVSYFPADKTLLRVLIIDDKTIIRLTLAELELINSQAQGKRKEIYLAIPKMKAKMDSAVKLAQACKHKEAETEAAEAKTLLNAAQQQATELSSLLSSVSSVAEKGCLEVTFPESRSIIDEKEQSLLTAMRLANAPVVQDLNEIQVALERVINQLKSRGGLELRITANDTMISQPVKVSGECLPQTLVTIPNRPLKIDNLPIGTHQIHIELSHWLTADIQVAIEKDRYTVIPYNFRSGTLRVQIPRDNVRVFLDEQSPSVEGPHTVFFDYVSPGEHQLTVIFPDGEFQQKAVTILPPVTIVKIFPQHYQRIGLWGGRLWAIDDLNNVEVFRWGRGDVFSLAFLSEGRAQWTFGAQVSFSYQNPTEYDRKYSLLRSEVASGSVIFSVGPPPLWQDLGISLSGGVAGYKRLDEDTEPENGSRSRTSPNLIPSGTRASVKRSTRIIPVADLSVRVYLTEAISLYASGGVDLKSVYETLDSGESIFKQNHAYRYEAGIRAYITSQFNLNIGYGQWHLGDRNVKGLQIAYGYTF